MMKYEDINVKLINWMGSDLTVVNAARVSFAAESEYDFGSYDDFKDNPEFEYNIPVNNNEFVPTGNFRKLKAGDKNLIRFLAKNNHWSPFSHCQLQFRITAPLFLARQLGKHQVGLAWNEISRRYVDDDKFPVTFYKPKYFRQRDPNVKQGSIDIPVVQEPLVDDMFAATVQSSLISYTKLIDLNVCPEQARMVLPQNMMTQWYWTGSLYAFARICKLRLEKTAQRENKEVVEPIKKAMESHFPESTRALLND